MKKLLIIIQEQRIILSVSLGSVLWYSYSFHFRFPLAVVYTAAGYVYHRETSVLQNNIEMKSHLLIFHSNIPALNPGFQNDRISFYLKVNDPLHTAVILDRSLLQY